MFDNKLFDVEHALSMYAYSFVHFPAFAIYDDAATAKYDEIIKQCHIYLIGTIPTLSVVNIRQERRTLIVKFKVLSELHDITWPIPDGFDLVCDDELWTLRDVNGRSIFPDETGMMARFHSETGLMNFEIKYIGQSYGSDGSRNALDRLKKHETLQKIALQGIPGDYVLQLLLLEIQPNNRIMTMIIPGAEEVESGEKRIQKGIDKLYGTNEKERITLYEASLIRYFQPEFNKEFKDSFPSTNMKVLRDCYDKDFSAVVAEIVFDNMPYSLMSDCVPPKLYHTIVHDLHDDARRKVFFS